MSAFELIRDWTSAATEHPPADNPLDSQPLRDALPQVCAAGAGLLATDVAPQRDANGRTLLPFALRGPSAADGVKTRFVLPAHFAAMLAMTLSPGFRIHLADNTRRNDKRQGRERDSSELIFATTISIPARKSLRLPKRTSSLIRILFDAPPNAQLHELRGVNHQHIIPAAFALTKYRPVRSPLTRTDVLDRVIEPRLAALLRDTFALADHWHWHELLGRIPADRQRDAAALLDAAD